MTWWPPATAPPADRDRPRALDVLASLELGAVPPSRSAEAGDADELVAEAARPAPHRGPGPARPRRPRRPPTAVLPTWPAVSRRRRAAGRGGGPGRHRHGQAGRPEAQLRQRRRRPVRGRGRRPPGPGRDGRGARRCFRVDANLRPEGRTGPHPVGRQLRSYWNRWAAPWEFQALLKAAPVAGDPDVGRRGLGGHARAVEPPLDRRRPAVAAGAQARAEAEVAPRESPSGR